MKIIIEPRRVYGTEAFYPICDTAVLLAKLVGTKTLTPHSLKLIKDLGYEITMKQVYFNYQTGGV